MYLNKLLLKDFGKFHNKEITLKSGINLIYGEAEAGKSTIKEFVIGMLYGMDQSSDFATKFDAQEEYKPFYSNGYSGKAYINIEGKSHLIERSFLRFNRTTSVMDIQLGREVTLRNANTLYGTLLNMEKSAYVNTLCIGEHGTDSRQALASEMKRYLTNLTTTGSVDIDKDMAIAYLKERRHEFDTKTIQKTLDKIEGELATYATVDDDLTDIRAKIRETEEELAIETERRKREARQLMEDKEDSDDDGEVTYDDIRKEYEAEKLAEEEAKQKGDKPAMSKMDVLDAELSEDEEDIFPKKKLTDRLWFIFLTGIFVVCVIALMVSILPFEKGIRQLFILCTALFVIVTIAEGLYAKSELEENGSTPSDDEFLHMLYKLDRKSEVNSVKQIDMSFAQAFLDRKGELQEAERILLNKCAKRDELREEYNVYKNKLDNSERELHAILFAINTINELSVNLQQEFGEVINNHISDIVSRITDGRYKDVYIDDRYQIFARENNGFVDIKQLDIYSLEQIYLAMRLAVARSLCRDHMPVVVDDIFAGCEVHQIKSALDCLRTIESEQLILFTSNPNMKVLLDDMDVSYNYVML